MSERKLATIRRVAAVDPIPDADKIERVTVDGWQCVCKKGELRVGDPCLYIEIDSLLPETNKAWEFMANRHFRVKTIKLRKQVSQGLCLKPEDAGLIKYSVGDDVTKQLGITKYEVPDPKQRDSVTRKKHNWFTKFMTRFQWYRVLTHTKSKSFPEWISKTDETRVQNAGREWDKWKEQEYVVTEKLDGQSATYWYKKKLFGYEFGICSRTVRKSLLDGSNWSKAAVAFDIKNKLKKVGTDICIQGELCGPGIQQNRLQLKERELFIFNVYDIKAKRYYNYGELRTFCNAFGFKHVPIITVDYKLPETIQELVDSADGKSVVTPSVIREGLVYRTYDMGISFKAVSNKFLLKHGE